MNNALKHFRKTDPVLYELSRKISGFSELKPKDPKDYFESLCESFAYQQLSGKAAATIWQRVKNLFNNRPLTPFDFLNTEDEDLRTTGLSRPKISYIKDLSAKIINRELDFDKFIRLSDEEIIQELIKIKGIGRWTGEMFLIFVLGKEDVFSEGDLGLKTAIQKYKGLKDSKFWSPYRSYASLILWKAKDENIDQD